MSISFEHHVHVPDTVLVSELDGESVLLNLKSETYFGLDEVGSRMWTAMTTAESIQAAFDLLREEYDVEPERLREDLSALLAKLLEHGLLEARGSEAPVS